MKATITSKGQITIPASIRNRLGLAAGQVLEFDETAPFLKARRVLDQREARKIIGCARDQMKGKRAADWLEIVRGPVELPRHAARRR